MPVATLAKHYNLLDGPERFIAIMEAMARGDREEEERLDEACPRLAYIIDDPSYRKRMSVSYAAASQVCAAIQRDMAVIYAVATTKDVLKVFQAYVVEGAEEAYISGLSANDPKRKLDGTRKAQLAKISESALMPMNVVSIIITRKLSEPRAASVLSAWEGLSRFSRECCGIEPLVLAKAWRLLQQDPTVDVKQLHPDAVQDEQEAEQWHQSLARAWEKQFSNGPPGLG